MADVSKLETKLKEKQNETKFTTEEMSKLDEVRNSYATIQQHFGQTAMIKLRLEEQIKELNTRVESLKTEYLEVQKNEENFLTEVNKKYGEGELNPETGIFTSNKS